MGISKLITKVGSAISFGGAIAIFAAGVAGSIIHQTNVVENMNKHDERIMLEHTKDDLTYGDESFSLKRVSYIMADHYLYNKKGIRINTLDEGLKMETSGGLNYRSTEYYNSLVKEVAKFENGSFVDVDPTSQEYKDILALRKDLATALTSNEVFEQNSEELTGFASHLLENFDNAPLNWDFANTCKVVGISLASLLAGALFFIGSEVAIMKMEENNFRF